MKSTGTTYWQTSNIGATNESGFSALPGGFRRSNGSFDYTNGFAYFWSATVRGINGAWYRYLDDANGSVYRVSYGDYGIKSVGASVRCLRN
jgi:uncharacterized protein (TIGR02145 family)